MGDYLLLSLFMTIIGVILTHRSHPCSKPPALNTCFVSAHPLATFGRNNSLKQHKKFLQCVLLRFSSPKPGFAGVSATHSLPAY